MGKSRRSPGRLKTRNSSTEIDAARVAPEKLVPHQPAASSPSGCTSGAAKMARNDSAPKSSRRSRKPRVSTSISAELLKYEPSADDWIEMERAIARPIQSDLRSETIVIVQRYFRTQSFETNAPFLDDVLKRLSLIARATEQLQKVLDASNSDNIVDIVRAQIEQAFEGHKIDALDEMLRSLVSASLHAEIEFNEQSESGFAEGAAWQEMVSTIKALMRSHSMPYGASQDGTKAKDPNKGSRFVQFIQSLQQTFPVGLRRHSGISPFALAKEINRTGRIVRKKKGH
jgi:hypothetical protein